ncbi:MAG: helix-turn-helix domain-containing protein, partial [[Clostridium] leptum]
MAVFRVEKNSGYTVMSNHHLRNKELTLKAKGLLSQMLSLPDTWDYTLHGLARINKESIDAIRTAVWELEGAGYITRRQGRDEKGKMAAIEYTIYEQPQLENPILENPTTDNPMLENPMTDNPMSENPTQLNKDISRTDLSKK